jgi:hypothetical protein
MLTNCGVSLESEEKKRLSLRKVKRIESSTQKEQWLAQSDNLNSTTKSMETVMFQKRRKRILRLVHGFLIKGRNIIR